MVIWDLIMINTMVMIVIYVSFWLVISFDGIHIVAFFLVIRQSYLWIDLSLISSFLSSSPHHLLNH